MAVLSPKLLADLRSVVDRRKFQNLINPADAGELIAFLETRALQLTPVHSLQLSRDPDDDHVLSLAVEAGATAVISGDKDLTSLGFVRRIPILTPRQFLAWLAAR